jgi:hypothetical protein
VNNFQVIRIVALLAVIFAAGVVTGRLTAPQPASQSPIAGGRVFTGEAALDQLTLRLGLDAEQQVAFQPLLVEMAHQIAQFPPASEERREVFRSYVPKMRELLRSDQHAAFDRHVQITERRIERLIRRREAQ